MAAASHSQPGASVPESEDTAQNGTETAEGLGFQSEKAKAKADAKARAKAEKEAKKAANVCSAAVHSMSKWFDCLPLTCCCDSSSGCSTRAEAGCPNTTRRK